MTSAAYSEQRSELARALGLGQQRRKTVTKSAPEEVVSEPVEEAVAPAPEKKRRGPRKKQAA